VNELFVVVAGRVELRCAWGRGVARAATEVLAVLPVCGREHLVADNATKRPGSTS
jgi:hypothetical protein